MPPIARSDTRIIREFEEGLARLRRVKPKQRVEDGREIRSRLRRGRYPCELGRQERCNFWMLERPDGLNEVEHADEVVTVAERETKEERERILASGSGQADEKGAEGTEMLRFRLAEKVPNAVER